MAATRGGATGGRAARRALHLAQLLFFASLSLCLTTCGIQTTTSFFQPPQFVSPSPNLIQLTHNTANNVGGALLKGYEVYYRAFDTLATAESARSAIEQATVSLNATPETCLNLMQSSGFSRIFDADGNDGPNGIRPLFTVTTENLNTALQYNIILDFGTLPSTAVNSNNILAPNNTTVPYWYYYQTVATNPHYAITRSISTQSIPVSFESGYNANTTPSSYDYTGNGSGIGSTLYFVFFAVAYGIDTSGAATFNPIYSLPASLYIPALPYTLPPVIQ